MKCFLKVLKAASLGLGIHLNILDLSTFQVTNQLWEQYSTKNKVWKWLSYPSLKNMIGSTSILNPRGRLSCKERIHSWIFFFSCIWYANLFMLCSSFSYSAIEIWWGGFLMLLRTTSNSNDCCWHRLFTFRGDLVGATGYWEVRSFFWDARMSCYY